MNNVKLNSKMPIIILILIAALVACIAALTLTTAQQKTAEASKVDKSGPNISLEISHYMAKKLPRFGYLAGTLSRMGCRDERWPLAD